MIFRLSHHNLAYGVGFFYFDVGLYRAVESFDMGDYADHTVFAYFVKNGDCIVE